MTCTTAASSRSPSACTGSRRISPARAGSRLDRQRWEHAALSTRRNPSPSDVIDEEWSLFGQEALTYPRTPWPTGCPANINTCLSSCTGWILLFNGLAQGLDGFITHKVNGTPAKAATQHASPQYAWNLPRNLYQRIQF